MEIDGSPMPADLEPLLVSALVEDSQRLPDMFSLRFRDPERIVLTKTNAKVGGKITIKVNMAGASGSKSLIEAEITALELEFDTSGTFTIIRGYGRLAGPGRVDVDGRVYATPRVVIATGSVTAPPPIEGLEATGYWTNRETMALRQVPERTAVLGGGPVGSELGQMLSRYGSRVCLIHSGPRLLDREEPRVGELLGRLLSRSEPGVE